jgi:hypothetical protein
MGVREGQRHRWLLLTKVGPSGRGLELLLLDELRDGEETQSCICRTSRLCYRRWGGCIRGDMVWG